VDPPEQFRNSPAPLLRALLEQEICDFYIAARVLLAKGMRRLAWRQVDRAHALTIHLDRLTDWRPQSRMDTDRL
jgi:hypothetical protein